MKQDITQHSDQELSLIFFNDEDLYLKRRWALSIVDELFIYTPEQLAVLIEDLEEDENENNR